MRILIIGAKGLLGSFLYDKLHEKYNVFGSSRNKIKNYYKLDLNSCSNIKKIIKAGRFDVIINTSGLIDVNKCNKNLALAKKFNTQSIKKLSNVLKEVDQKPHLIHFSTDQIYNSEDPTKSNKEPWPMSPNMTPNRKGKVTVVNIAGFASLYLGTPYVSTIS